MSSGLTVGAAKFMGPCIEGPMLIRNASLQNSLRLPVRLYSSSILGDKELCQNGRVALGCASTVLYCSVHFQSEKMWDAHPDIY